MLRLLPLVFVCACTALAPTESPRLSQWPDTRQTLIGLGSHGSPGESAALTRMHVRYTRVTYYTHLTTPQYQAEFGARLLDFRTQGIEPLVVVHDFFPYAVLPTATLAQLAQRFPGTMWQIGNEWDASPHYRGTDYAYLLYFVHAAMRAADPSVRLVGMGMATTDGHAWAFAPDDVRQSHFLREYLAWFAAVGVEPPPIKAWAIHAYGVPLSIAITARVQATRAVLQDRYPLWITEVGVDRVQLEQAWGPMTAAQTDQHHATQTADAITTARALGVARLYFYQLWDGADDQFGFVRADAFTERPAAHILRQYLP